MQREMEIEQLKKREVSISSLSDNVGSMTQSDLEELEKTLQQALSKVSREIGKRQIA